MVWTKESLKVKEIIKLSKEDKGESVARQLNIICHIERKNEREKIQNLIEELEIDCIY